MPCAIARFDYVSFATGQFDPFVPADVAAPAAQATRGAQTVRRRIARRRRPYLGGCRLGALR